MKRTVEYVCGNCDEAFDVVVWPATPATRDDPACPAELEPGECPHCGVEVNEEYVLELVEDQDDVALEDAAEAREEMRREDK